MIDSPYWRSAAEIIICRGTLMVRAVDKNPHEAFLEEKRRCNSYIGMPMSSLLPFVTGQLSPLGVALQWLTGKITIEGIVHAVVLLRLFLIFKKSR